MINYQKIQLKTMKAMAERYGFSQIKRLWNETKIGSNLIINSLKAIFCDLLFDLFFDSFGFWTIRSINLLYILLEIDFKLIKAIILWQFWSTNCFIVYLKIRKLLSIL